MIVVTTPTGHIGRHVLRHLVDAGEAVRVVVRDASKLPQDINTKVEVIEGSHGDAAIVDRAFEGAEAVFWVVPPTPGVTLDETYLHFTRPAAEAIRRLGVPRVVVVTALGRGTAWEDRAGLVTASIRMVDPAARHRRGGSRPRHARFHGERIPAGGRDQAGADVRPDRSGPEGAAHRHPRHGRCRGPPAA